MKDTFYFQHDYNARNDPKLQRLMMRHGVMGIGIYWCIVEMMYEQGGKLENNYIEVIAFNLHCDKTIIEEIVFELNLFVFDDTHFWSKRVLDRANERNNFKTIQKQRANKRGAPAGNNNAKKNNSENNSETIQINSETNTKQKNNSQNNSEVSEDTENQELISGFEKTNKTIQINSENNSETIKTIPQNKYETKNNSEKPIIREEEIREDISSSLRSEECREGGKNAGRFVPPTLGEVEAYAVERGYEGFDAEAFVDFYQSKGWMVGKNKMKDWQASARRWHKTNTETPRPSYAPRASTTNPKNINDEWNE